MKDEQTDPSIGLIASVSHELRGSLHAVLGLSELLLQSELDSREFGIAHSIHQEAHAMRVLVDDILVFGRLESDDVQLDRQAFSPRAEVAGIVEALRADAAAKDLTLWFDAGPSVPRLVLGDRTRFGQVVRNLVTNAVRYTAEGEVSVSITQLGIDVIACSVSDTGPGIPAEHLDDIFLPFVRLQSGADGAPGNGLGLAITRRLVEAMGATIDVHSVVGQGSEFVFEFQFEPAGSDGAPPSASLPLLRTGSTLVIEDSKVNQIVATNQLRLLGLDSTCVESGEEALELLGRESFDLLLMDWNLPGMDGLSTAREIRSRRLIDDNTPIVAMTANVLAGDREKCLSAGMDNYLAKPVSLDELRAVVSACLGAPVEDRAASDTEFEDGLRRLESELGDVSLVHILVETFLEELPSRREALVGENRTLDEAKRAAHTLRSTSSLVGADRLAWLCGQYSDKSATDSALDLDVTTEMDRVETHFTSYLGRQALV